MAEQPPSCSKDHGWPRLDNRGCRDQLARGHEAAEFLASIVTSKDDYELASNGASGRVKVLDKRSCRLRDVVFHTAADKHTLFFVPDDMALPPRLHDA
ncbi:hypothetical protein KM043_009182 [Ampulex compressa]|nr:hypothetical protein KM043_009182 [Ampulex compressa]